MNPSMERGSRAAALANHNRGKAVATPDNNSSAKEIGGNVHAES